MTTAQSLLLGIRSSGDYFVSTFLFGIMFGIAAYASPLADWQALLMSATSFTASGQFAALEFWSHPLPLGTIALSVLLVSTRNVLLGMAMAHRFDGHGLLRRITWLFLLNDPGVVTSYRVGAEVDRLGYVTGYGIAMMVSWLSSVSVGLLMARSVSGIDLQAVSFAGPLVMTTMMILFIKGAQPRVAPWAASGLAALLFSEIGAGSFGVLLLSVLVGVVVVLWQGRRRHV